MKPIPEGVRLIRLECGKANAIDERLLDTLERELDVALEEGARAVVLTGYDKYFSAGLNLTGLPDTREGMFGFAKSLARTAAPHGITVNCVAPGIVDTKLLHQTHGEARVAELAAEVPLGLGTCRDIGLAVAYLAGEGGRYITGATLDVNGGINMR